MKRLASLLLLLSLLLCACSGAESGPALRTEATSEPPLGAPEGLRIAVASDLHLNPDNRPSSDEPDQSSLSPELVDALLWDARRQGAKLLLLTGDLSNGGRVQRHALLAEKLRAAEAAGMDVYVLPGNHDLSPITQTGFAEIYADFGFSEAYSRDAASLSYCVVRDGLLLLMMDTGGYYGAVYDLPASPGDGSGSAFLSEQTLAWVAEMLDMAREQGLTVLAAGHYNLLSPLARSPENAGYYIQNGERLAALLREAGALLYLSGHIHIRAVYEAAGLRELVTEYLLAYPTAYSVLDLNESTLRYIPRRIDVNAWARETGRTEPYFLDYAQWQQNGLRAYARQSVGDMAVRNALSARESEQAADFFYFVMDAYWRGTLAAERAEAEAMPGRDAFFRCAEGYAYGWWLRDLIDSASPALGGFTVKR